MRHIRIMRSAVVALVAVAGFAGAAQAPLTALATIEPGQWQLRDMDGGTSRSICLSDARMLIQLHHPGVQCSRFVVTNDPKAAVVHYTCPGAGHGRTTISTDGRRSFRLQTQGIADAAPFDISYEGRRTGACN